MAVLYQNNVFDNRTKNYHIKILYDKLNGKPLTKICFLYYFQIVVCVEAYWLSDKMKVIHAGFSKTGTKTIAEALSILGYNVYDALENSHYLHREWNKMLWEGGSSNDFQRMYEGVDAVTDLPCFNFWEQLHEAFPEAKVNKIKKISSVLICDCNF